MQIRLTSLETGTREEYEFLETLDHELNRRLPDDLLDLFAGTDRDTGYPISPMRHGLQTATRAFRDGADEEMIVAALLHDVADRVGPVNHARVGAEMLRPYISERTWWVIAHHSIFQGYYYWHHVGKDRNARDKYRGHPHFEACAAFCERWDQVSFDPSYQEMPLDAFRPMLGRLLERTPYSTWPST